MDKLLRSAQPLPPITWSNWYREIRWFNLSVVLITPLIASYGALTTHLETRTFWFCAFYYVFNMIGGSAVRIQCTTSCAYVVILLGIFRNYGWYVPQRFACTQSSLRVIVRLSPSVVSQGL